MSPSEMEGLDRLGYVMVQDVLDQHALEQVRKRIEDLYEQKGENAGSEFRTEPGARRLANLVDKGQIFEQLILTPEILERVQHVLGPFFKLSSFNARSTDPFTEDAQPLHCDAGAIADNQGFWVCNTIWLLDDFTPENGPTRVVPGSHRWAQLPQEVLSNPAAQHPDGVVLLGKACSVVVMNTHAWHGGTANRTANPRRALHAFFSDQTSCSNNVNNGCFAQKHR